MGLIVGTQHIETVEVTADKVDMFAKCTGDYNPIHMDDDYAKNTRFGKRIAHGMLSAGFISRVLAMRLGAGGIYLAQSLKFLKPVFVGETITVEVKVLTFQDKRSIGTLETIVKNSAGEIAVKGEATIMLADKI